MNESNSPIEMFKNIYSTIFLIFSTAVLMTLIFEENTKLAAQNSPILALIVLWVAVLWLTMIEGGQASKVGLIPVDLDLYKESHPLAHKSMALVAQGDNLDRYLMGRQFMVVLIVFCVNLSGGPTVKEIWDLPDWLTWLMFTFPFGVMTLFTCMIGQLNSQVNAAHCMLDYINNYFALFTLYVAMLIEFSGLLHASYLVAMAVGSMSGKPIESKEPPKEGGTLLFFWLRGLFSVAVLGFSLAVVLKSLFMGRTDMYEGVGNVVSVILFFVLMSVVGMLEGMQIAFFAVTKIPIAERGSGKFAKMTCELLFRGEGRNLPGFMIGRQICVVSCMIIVARVTTVTETPPGEENILGVSDGLQKFLELGFQGALVTTILGSISWQLVASAFPIEFLTFPGTYILLRLCLWLEATGICSGAWVLAAIHKKFANFQHDEVYIGTAEERAEATKAKGGNQDAADVGNLARLPGFMEVAPQSLQNLVKNDPTILHYIESIRQMQLEGELDDDVDIETAIAHAKGVKQPSVPKVNHIISILDYRGNEIYKLNSKNKTSVGDLLDMIGDGMLKTDDGFLIASKSFILKAGTYTWAPKNAVIIPEEDTAEVEEPINVDAAKPEDTEELIQLDDV